MTSAPNFDRVARIYRWAEYLALGTLLEHTREHFLPQVLDRRRALVLGDGDGRFLAKLLERNPDIHALAIDTSSAMLHLLRERCLKSARYTSARHLRTMQASALEIQASKDTDLIVTHFFLDCLTQPELDALAQRLAAQVNSGTLWLVSDFALPQARMLLLRAFAAAYIRALYFAFRILTGLRVTHLPDTQSALHGAAFVRTARHERLFGFVYTEVWRRQ